VGEGLRWSRAVGRNVKNLGSEDPSYIGKLEAHLARELELIDPKSEKYPPFANRQRAGRPENLEGPVLLSGRERPRQRVNSSLGLSGVSFSSVRLTPIFDTSAIINLSKRDSTDSVWTRLKTLVPRHGCPLSYVTVLELIHGLRLSGNGQLDDSLKAVVLASRLSRRAVLLSPYPFIERELFGIRNQESERSSANLKRWLGIAIGPTFKTQFAVGRVEGMNLEKIESLFAFIKQRHSIHLEQFLNRLNPTWRLERENSGSSIPEEQREEFKRTVPVDKWKRDCAEYLLNEMKIERTTDTTNAVRDGCDAYFTFTVSLLRDSIISNYRFDENPNDFHDGIQLLYLSRPWFCLVTEDKRSIKRASNSSQSNRILTIDQFIAGE
jgi:hypothetical protein